MKQTCYLLASVLMAFMSAGSAEAAAGDVITSLSNLSNSKCYTITTERGQMVANASKTAVCSSLTHGAATGSASTEAADGQWAILKLDDNGYYLFNVGTRLFLKSTCLFNANVGEFGDALTVQAATSPNGNYMFKITSGTNTLNNDDYGNIMLNSWNTEDAGNLITITEAGDFDATIFNSSLTLTYDYYVDNQKIYSDTKTTFQTQAYPAPTKPDYTECDTPAGTAQASDNGKTFNIPVTIASSFPFKYSAESTAWSDLFWYRLKINNKYIVYDESVTTDKCNLLTDATTAVNDKIAFAFIGDPYNGFRIVNYTKGESYTLSNSNNPYDGNTGGSTFPTMKLRSGLTVGTTKGNDVEKYYVAKATSTAFFVQMNTFDGDNQNTYVRMNNRGALAFWNFGSGVGSYFTVERVVPPGETVSSLDNIVQGQAYTITAAGLRGSFIYTANGLSSTQSTGTAVDMTDKNQQFLFVKHEETYYLYSVGAGAFINVTGKNENNNRAVAVAGKPVNTSLEFLASTNESYNTTYPVVLSIDKHQVGVSNGYTPAVITHYNDLSDEGNALCIKTVAGVTYDMTDINALLDQGEEKDFEVARNAIVAEVENNGRISVLFSASDVAATKEELNAVTYSAEDGLDASVAKLSPVLEKFYKKAEGKKFSIRNTPDTYFLTAAKTEIRARDATLGLDGVFEVKYNGNKKYYLHGVYNDVYVNKPVSYNTAPTTSATPANDFYIGALDGNTNKVYFANETSGYNSIHFSTSYIYYTCGWTYEAGNSQWVISEVTDEQYAGLEPWPALTKAVNLVADYSFGTGLCQYNPEKITAARAMLEAKTASADEVSAAITAISPDNLTLNMPAEGQFIRIKDSAGNYMTCNNTTDSKIEFSSAQDESSVFCYTSSALIAYKTGFYASRSSNFPCNMTSVTAEGEGTVYHIHTSRLNKGKYLVSFGGDTRFMYTAGNAGSYASPSVVNNAGYEFTLEEVETIPVTISDAKMGTLYSPMALQIPEGVTAYTGVYDSQSNSIKLTALEGVIPANTGVIIEGEAKTYDFTTTTGTEGTSCLSGTAPGIANVTGAYTLQVVGNNIGLYKYTGENLCGFKAYFVNSSGSKGFSFVKDDDPTGISAAGADITGSGECYDLQGNRVTLPLKNRIYILNGKKVLIK